MPGSRNAYAIVTADIGKNTHKQYRVRRIEAYTFEQAMDNDSDPFSLDIGNTENELTSLLKRDTEVRADIYLENAKGIPVPQFTGIADRVTLDSDDMALSIIGRDFSSIALTDSTPGKWQHVKPKPFITARARKLGFTNIHIPSMSEIGTLYQDGSETEWAFWYRIARKKKMWMWTQPNGQLVIGKLGYSLAASYTFGHGRNAITPERVSITKDTSGRLGEVWVYAYDAKTNIGFRGISRDQTIKGWKRLPRKVMTSTEAKSTEDARTEAELEVFESIVGAFEIELTIHDNGVLIEQNKMAKVDLPELELAGTYFIVGVRKQGGMSGMTQVVRLRQKEFALSKRVPSDPKITTPGDKTTASSLGAALATIGGAQGVRWADSFVRAAREFGTRNGWDTGVFLGVLLAICKQESNFTNVRESGDYEWQSYDRFQNDPRNLTITREQEIRRKYEKTFANSAGNNDNPFAARAGNGEAGVGPMQLTTLEYKQWADQYGWNGVSNSDEYIGGRWNPDSNIRASARALLAKLHGVDPTNANNIWIGVARYNGSSISDTYAGNVKHFYDTIFQAVAQGSIAAADKISQGAQTKTTVPGHGTVEAPEEAPQEVKKAINFCERRLGDPYQWGGSGPYYDCSSLVTAAYAAASPSLRAVLDEPRPGNHGESTYTLFRKGRFPQVLRDNLRAGDLVFFDHGGGTPEHVGIYVADGLFISDPHTGDVVKFSSINETYYRERWLGARRLVEWDLLSPKRHNEG